MSEEVQIFLSYYIIPVNYFMYNVDCRPVNNRYIMYKHCISLLKKYLPPQTQKKTNVNVYFMNIKKWSMTDNRNERKTDGRTGLRRYYHCE